MTFGPGEIYVEFNADEAPKEDNERFQLKIESYEESQMSQFMELERLPAYLISRPKNKNEEEEE